MRGKIRLNFFVHFFAKKLMVIPFDIPRLFFLKIFSINPYSW